jgi:hypothetical protein
VAARKTARNEELIDWTLGENESFAEVARAYGVKRQTVFKIVRKFAAQHPDDARVVLARNRARDRAELRGLLLECLLRRRWLHC